MSAARAFLHPAKGRANLTIRTGIEIDRVLFDGRRAVAVEGRGEGGDTVRIAAGKDIIVCSGALPSPLILQRSGVGPAGLLGDLCIAVVSDLPGVGGNMAEHYLLMNNYRLKHGVPSYNSAFTSIRLAANALRCMPGRKGPLSNGSHDAIAFIRTDPAFDQPNAEILTAAWSVGLDGAMEGHPGMHMFAYNLRPESKGSIRLSSSRPGDAPVFRPSYLATEGDRRCAIDSLRFMRRLAATAPLASLIAEETRPGPCTRSDEEILDAYRTMGQIGHHASGTCRMGAADDPHSVVDPQVRVHGVDGLRVCDISIMPAMVSGNTNGPAMVMGWLAAEIIADSNARQ